jgi:hypothetical protein
MLSFYLAIALKTKALQLHNTLSITRAGYAAQDQVSVPHIASCFNDTTIQSHAIF